MERRGIRSFEDLIVWQEAIEFVKEVNIAKGSAGETRSLFRVGLEVGYFKQQTYERLLDQAMTLSRYLFNQMEAIKRAPLR